MTSDVSQSFGQLRAKTLQVGIPRMEPAHFRVKSQIGRVTGHHAPVLLLWYVTVVSKNTMKGGMRRYVGGDIDGEFAAIDVKSMMRRELVRVHYAGTPIVLVTVAVNATLVAVVFAGSVAPNLLFHLGRPDGDDDRRPQPRLGSVPNERRHRRIR